MNIKTKLILGIGMLAGMIILLVTLSSAADCHRT